MIKNVPFFLNLSLILWKGKIKLNIYLHSPGSEQLPPSTLQSALHIAKII